MNPWPKLRPVNKEMLPETSVTDSSLLGREGSYVSCDWPNLHTILLFGPACRSFWFRPLQEFASF